jgi:YVTN family beta-propeller protein
MPDLRRENSQSIANRTALIVALATSTLVLPCAADPTMEVVQRWKLGGAGGWDYLTLDSATHRLFISRANRVDVVDTQSGHVLGTIGDTQGVHGIALALDLHRGFTSNGKADSITVFDLDSLRTLREVPLSAHNPDSILYEPSGKHVFTFNGKSKDVTVLDASSLAVVATIPLPDKPEFAVDDHAGQIFVNIESDPGQIVALDSRRLAVKATWPLPGCDRPSGLAMDRVHRRLFSVCDDKVMAVTNADDGSSVSRVSIGEGPDAAAFDEKRSLVLSSNGEGSLTVVREESPDHYRIIETVRTQRGARTMALDSVSGKVYLVTADLSPAPAPTPEQPRPRPVPVPDTFTVMVVDLR